MAKLINVCLDGSTEQVFPISVPFLGLSIPQDTILKLGR